MKRFIIVGAALALCGLNIAIAQSDVLSSTAVMREQGNIVYRSMNGMVKGEAPYDKAKAEELFAQLAATTVRIPAAFPESNKGKTSEKSRYSASPKLWETPDQFKAAIATMAKAIADNRSKTTTLEEFKGAVTAVNNACNACHDTFRVRVN